MRRVVAFLAALVAALACAGPASAWDVGKDVVGGTDAGATDAPWQVLLMAAGYQCGGTIVDDLHVVTAAHCVVHNGTKISPAVADVYAGAVDPFNNPSHHAGVAEVLVHPAYDWPAFDAAVLKLSAPLPLGPQIRAIGLATADDDAALTSSTPLLLTGWGWTGQSAPGAPNAGTLPDVLQKVTITPATGCNQYSAFDAATMLCAGQPGYDACQGDSGGPLVLDPAGTPKLVGIVSGGSGCAWTGFPGFYTRVGAAEIRPFLADPAAGLPAPVNVTAPAVSGSSVAGSTLMCGPGTWTGARSFSFRFVQGDANVVRDWSTSPAYAAGTGSIGATIHCEVTAHGLGGDVTVSSGGVTITAPVTTPVPQSDVPAPGAAPATAARAPDAVAPVARVTGVRCARTMCVLDVRVDDPAPSSGIRTVEGTVATKYRTWCGKGRKRHRCTKTAAAKRLPALPTGPGAYRVTTPKLRAGTQTFAFVGVDAEGNRQLQATKLTRRTG